MHWVRPRLIAIAGCLYAGMLVNRIQASQQMPGQAGCRCWLPALGHDAVAQRHISKLITVLQGLLGNRCMHGLASVPQHNIRSPMSSGPSGRSWTRPDCDALCCG